MKRYQHIVFLLSLVVISACVRTTLEGSIQSFDVFQAGFSDLSMTKAHLQNDSKMVWDSNDVIGIFSDIQSPEIYNYSGDNLFKGSSVCGSKFYAYYPLSMIVFDADNPLLLQTYSCEGGSGEDVLYMPLIAQSDGSTLHFKHTCGLLHFSVKGTLELIGIRLSGNSGEPLRGVGFINLAEETPILQLDDPDTAASEWFLSVSEREKEKDVKDFYYPLPVMSFESGVTVEVFYKDAGTGLEKKAIRKTDKFVQISRASMKSFATIDLDAMIEEDLQELEEERDILIAFYNAMGGDGWNNKTNWGSDQPLNEWYGVGLDETGHVRNLILSNNNLIGKIPAVLSGLKHVVEIYLSNNHITGVETGFQPMPSLESIALNENNFADFPLALVEGSHLKWLQMVFSGCESLPAEAFDYLKELTLLSFGEHNLTMDAPIPPEIKKMANIEQLELHGFSGDIPAELYELTSLKMLNIASQKMTGTISPSIKNLTKLQDLCLSSTTDGESPEIPKNQLQGAIPEELFECRELRSLYLRHTHLSGELPGAIGNLQRLEDLSLIDNDLTGNLPVELTTIPFENGTDVQLEMFGNKFSGKVPAAFKNWKPWQYVWGYIIGGNELDISEAMPPRPEFEVTLIDGSKYSSNSMENQNLTVLFQWATWCPHVPTILPVLKAAWVAFKDKGLDIVAWSSESQATIESFLELEEITWKNYHAVARENSILGSHYWLYGPYYPNEGVPTITAFDQNGEMVFSDILSDRDTFKPFLEEWFGETLVVGDMYESEDYGRDGDVVLLQAASIGSGIDLVLMADGFSDRQIANGAYRSAVDKAVTAFFSEETYAPYRDMFNIYMVEAVSKNEGLSGERVFGSYFGDGTMIGGDYDQVLRYTQKAIPEARLDDCTVIVLVNMDKYAGTNYYFSRPEGADYGRGLSFAFIPLYSDEEEFSGIVRHEAGGHGFAKLADEYSYSSNGAAPDDYIAKVQEYADYGWYKNIDVTGNPETIKWSSFISDARFASEQVGAYEGGGTYISGIWRPTINSIMNQNVGGFNAPSRYAIWYRIHKLAYGKEWTGTYEDFVKYDMEIRTKAGTTGQRTRQNYVEKQLPPLAPPVVLSRDLHEVITSGRQ